MKIYDIDVLKKDDDGYYDLTQLTFRYTPSGYAEYIVQKGEEMRIDLVCQSIYGNIEYIDMLCSINNIDNPLNIKEGYKIMYYYSSDINTLRFDDTITDSTTNNKILGNSNKSTRKDINRSKYIENSLSLPPTILIDKTEQFNINGNSIILGDGLFNK